MAADRAAEALRPAQASEKEDAGALGRKEALELFLVTRVVPATDRLVVCHLHLRGKRLSLAPGADRLGAANRIPPFTEAFATCHHGSRFHGWDAAGRHRAWRINRWAFWALRSAEDVWRR